MILLEHISISIFSPFFLHPPAKIDAGPIDLITAWKRHSQEPLINQLEIIMKKTLLNIAVSMALGSAVFSGSVLSTRAYADEFAPADNTTSNHSTSETYMYPGMGVGAATGTLIAGPVGLVVGGIIGALVGSNQEVSKDIDSEIPGSSLAGSSQDTNDSTDEIALMPASIDTRNPDTDNSIQLAQLGPVSPVISDDENTAHEELMNILVTDLSLDVYFRSGSIDIEKFYPARLAAIADLVNTMGDLELHLDGYTCLLYTSDAADDPTLV